MRVLIAMHKPYPFSEDPLYLPIQVGAALAGTEFGVTKDNTGENISDRNPGFCELTALYWGWKNLQEDYLGLVHYRRYFALHKGKTWIERVLTFAEAQAIVKHCPVIVPVKRRYYIETLYSHYAHTHGKEELDATAQTVAALRPEFVQDFVAVTQQKSAHMFNMMILRRDLLDDYCNFLFPILFALEERVGHVARSRYDARLYGRISEILFNVWLHGRLRDGTLRESDIRELPWITTEPVNWVRKGSAFLTAKFFGKRYRKSF